MVRGFAVRVRSTCSWRFVKQGLSVDGLEELLEREPIESFFALAELVAISQELLNAFIDALITKFGGLPKQFERNVRVILVCTVSKHLVALSFPSRGL